ncbi:hypothetical protein FUAX_49230 (plasmid) [Fulvitalea axinellae]|uniref:Sulfatase n=2 Tax=Fulvitalea axinellae TaxID=1182444 RepID=A0AAU9DHB0_9BACT|nr:hypothetical protein FUAX_49230 [Fulvitalea axinellae]
MAVLLSLLNFKDAEAQKKEKPNVIIIYTDDQGTLDLGCYGAKDLATPNIDRIARDGIRFTQGYVAASLCAPSRASLLTGKTPLDAGVDGNVSSMEGHAGMPASEYTMAEMMRDVGYATGHVGKWHLGYTKETMPNGQGFDYSFGHMGGCIDNYSHFFYWSGPNRHDLWRNGKEVFYDGQFFGDLMVDEVNNFVKQNRKKPFFMYWAINMPHYPYQPTEKWRKHYKDMPMPRRDYAAFVSTLDERIGKVLDYLEKAGLRENTIVIFQSDHGHSAEVRAFNGGGWSGPYRGAKTSLFEGGIRVPTIISWPAKLAKGETRDQMTVNTDWMPTLASLCDIDLPEAGRVGKDISPVLFDKTAQSPHDRFHWELGAQWAVREGDWKLVGNPKDPTAPESLDEEKDRLFLVNLADDISEKKNLASARPDIVGRLKKVHLELGVAKDMPDAKVREPKKHLAYSVPVESATPPSRKYAGMSGKWTLTDGILAFPNTGDKAWQGYEASDLEATFDLGEIKKVDEMRIGFLADYEQWVFPPKSVQVEISEDGKSYKTFGKTLKTDTEAPRSIKRVNIPLKGKARYMRIRIESQKLCPKWHKGSGNPAWMFVDEIELE